MEMKNGISRFFSFGFVLLLAFALAVPGVALAAGGFTTAALAHIFHREHYHAITRPALLTAMKSYRYI